MVATLTGTGPAEEPWPASIVLAGVERVHEWELTADERAALQAAAATVRAAAGTLAPARA
jgi:hypothetical protein